MSSLTSYTVDLGRMFGPFTDPADDPLGRAYNANGVTVDRELVEQIPAKLRAHTGLLVQDEHGKWSAA